MKEDRSVPRGLATLALTLAAAALATRALSSGLGQAMQRPGSVIVLDSLGLVAAMAAIASRFLAREPGLVPDRGVLAPLAVFLGLAFVGAFRSPGSGFATASSWAAAAALGLTIRDLGRRPGVAVLLAGHVVGLAVVTAALGVHEYVFELPRVRAMIERGDRDVLVLIPDPAMREAARWRAFDPKACGPFILPSHFAAALAAAAPLLAAAIWSRRKTPGPALAVLGGGSVLLLVGVALARSKGGVLALLGTLAGLGWFFVPEAMRRRVLVAGLVLALVAGGILVAGANREAFGPGMSFQVRLEYWQAGLAMAREAPVAGHGLESFQTIFPGHKSARAEETKHAHQDLLELLVELGVLGPIVFVWLVIALARARSDGEARSLDPGLAFPAELCVVLGAPLAGLVLLTHGDRYDVNYPWTIFIALAGALVVGRAFAASVTPGPLLAAAARAGAIAFLVTGLLDFPLRVHGLFAQALALAFLAPALEKRDGEPRRVHAAVPAAIAVVVGVLVLAGLSRVRVATAVDVLRADARDAYGEASLVLADRKAPLEAKEQALFALERSTQALRDILSNEELPPDDVRLLVASEDLVGRNTKDPRKKDLILRLLRDGVKHHPLSWAVWAELGDRCAGYNELDEAIQAYDRAAALHPTDPRRRLDAGAVRVTRWLAANPPEGVRERAAFELRAALVGARTSRLERNHLTESEVAVAKALLLAIGEAPIEPGTEEPPRPPEAGS